MSGKLAGVQALLKEEHLWLIYVHCAAHRLNLVLVKALKNLCPAMINIVDKLHSLFNSAKTNDSFEAEQKTLKIRVLKFPLRSETRWSSMFHVLDVICSHFKPIMLTLMKRIGDDDNAALTAGGLYHKMACGEFIINCVVLRKALATIHSLSEYLQGASIERHHVAHDIRACLHKVLAELELRFPDTGMELLKGLDGLNSTSQKYLKRKTLSKLIAHYGDVLDVNEKLLNAELAKYHMFANSGSRIVTMNPAFYPNLMKLFNLKRSLPVSSAEAERSFSTMKRVKT
ncbi:Zinc finger MYM-type protein 1-like [Oopsacas minuta]|uniref:Zinc finger MYM-type protein 1-like n=1 Tax=Oopsacas minuta TaxID=111878 RepID=A0AAV7K9Q5_9METZ|nr:Zinc finger MYM-type protein 1-like [Oopsacas minuta]